MCLMSSSPRFSTFSAVAALAALAAAALSWLLMEQAASSVKDSDVANVRPIIGDVLVDIHQVLVMQELRRCILVVGAESSGSKLVAEIAALALVWPQHRTEPDREDWRGHGNAVNITSGNVVMHRSFPHGRTRPYYPNVRGIVRELEDRRGCDVRLVISTRDQQLSLRSKLWAHQRNTRLALQEQAVAARMLRELLRPPLVAPTFIWSHESYLLLRDTYAERFLDFVFANRSALDAAGSTTRQYAAQVGMAPGLSAEEPMRQESLLPSFYDSNLKYTEAGVLGGLRERLARFCVFAAETLLFSSQRTSALVAADGRGDVPYTSVPHEGVAARLFCGHMGTPWEELSLVDRARWAALGWTQEGWDDEEGNFKPRTHGLGWDWLQDAERAAAIALGYDAQLWDLDVDEDERFTMWCERQPGAAKWAKIYGT